ncbi:hypothetical protein D1818_15895 [Aquimarina sp. BL5]|uniref:class I lanthipeptide n=1 Tax=Aquimarina sp. BL5 TaxID=1714860 RepID=UPI000E547A89|nr:class I lanthipeptide [Aquimarina sp. BL5]AXT52248.1 hypothetical protein D1818_15895 [Aquimarina sp. BL5]RKN09237.1 hypothetical protein D7036_04620 [Aquimarina sp. BL5]
MKGKQVKRKLSLDKLTIAKLSDTSIIKGGSTDQYSDHQNPNEPTATCASVITCTSVTGIGSATVGNRPTEKLTNCNCGVL